MSSHHFVTESQSTALFILGTNIQPDLQLQLLEWNPLIITRISQVERMDAENIKIDIMILEKEELPPALPYNFSVWKEASVFSELLNLNIKGDLMFVGCDDDEVSTLLRSYSDSDFNAVVFTKNKKHYLIRKGATFQKWMPADSRFSLQHENAAVSGPVKYEGNSFVSLENGMITIIPQVDIIFAEWI